MYLLGLEATYLHIYGLCDFCQFSTWQSWRLQRGEILAVSNRAFIYTINKSFQEWYTPRLNKCVICKKI